MKNILLPTLILSAATVASAQISLTNSDTASFLGGSVASHTFSNFDLTGGNAVGVILSFETTGGLGNYTITYGSETLTLGVSATDTGAGAQTAAIFYLLNPTLSVADLTVSVPAFDRFAVSAVALSNVGGIGDSAFGGNTDASDIALSYDGVSGGYLLSGVMENGFTNGDVATITGDNTPMSVLQSVAGNTNPEGGTVHWAGTIGSSGSFTSTVTDLPGDSSRNAAALLAFTAVPEPSTYALIFGAAMLGLMALRRRKA